MGTSPGSGDIGSNDTNYRGNFTQFLSKPCENCHWATFGVVKQMNKQMVRENVPMSEDHFKLATQSLKDGDKICEFLMKENTSVLKSNGTGFVYSMGKLFHQGVFFAKNMSGDGDNAKN